MRRKFLAVLVPFLLLTACGSLPSAPKLGAPAQSTPGLSADAPAAPQPADNPSSTKSSPVPLVSDPKALVDNLLKASDPDSRYAALLAVMRTLNVGVYDPQTGKAIVHGFERSSKDLYLYDFEVRSIANSFQRKTMRDLTYLTRLLNKLGPGDNGTVLDENTVRQAVVEAARSSAAAPDASTSLVYRLVRELGMRHDQPHDLLQDAPSSQLQFDALQLFLIEADVFIPASQASASLNQSPATRVAWNLPHGRALANPALDVPCEAIASIKGVTPFAKTFLTLVKFIKKGIAFVEIFHGEVLAFSVDVKAVSQSQSTHYGPAGHGANAGDEMRFQIKVEMLDDYGVTLVNCGAALGWQIPKKGPIPGVKMTWSVGDLDTYGTVRYEPADGKTNGNGIATLVFKPKDEKRPGQGPTVEKKGTVMGLAEYQSAFNNWPGSLAQYLTPKTDVIAWTVARHQNLTLEVSLEGAANLSDMSVKYGPNKITIPLETEGSNITGRNKGEFTASATFDGCTASTAFPVTFDVTAKGMDPLEFSVRSSVQAGQVTHECEDGGGIGKWPAGNMTRTFSLPAEDGAAKVYNTPMGDLGHLNLTFTLKEQ